MNKLALSKPEVAKRQLVVAVRLYFNDGDEVAIHTLAAASRNVLADLCAAKGVTHPLLLDQLLTELVDPKFHKDVRDRFREPENFFKHADRDPDEVLSFNAERTEYLLLEAVEAYTTLTGENVLELHLFRGWWLLHNQACLSEAAGRLLAALQGVQYRKDQRREFFADMSEAQRAA